MHEAPFLFGKIGRKNLIQKITVGNASQRNLCCRNYRSFGNNHNKVIFSQKCSSPFVPHVSNLFFDKSKFHKHFVWKTAIRWFLSLFNNICF